MSVAERVERHAARLVELLARQYTIAECAAALPLSERRVYAILADDPTIRQRAAALMAEQSPTETAVLRELMLTSRDERVRLQAAVALIRYSPDDAAASNGASGIVTLVIERYTDGRPNEVSIRDEDSACPEHEHVIDPVLAAEPG